MLHRVALYHTNNVDSHIDTMIHTYTRTMHINNEYTEWVISHNEQRCLRLPSTGPLLNLNERSHGDIIGSIHASPSLNVHGSHLFMKDQW